MNQGIVICQDMMKMILLWILLIKEEREELKKRFNEVLSVNLEVVERLMGVRILWINILRVSILRKAILIIKLKEIMILLCLMIE